MRGTMRWILAAMVATVVATACAPAATRTNGERSGVPGQRSAAPKRITAVMSGDPHTLYQKLNSNNAVRGIVAVEPLVNSGLVIEPEGLALRAQLAEAVPSLENGLWQVFPDGPSPAVVGDVRFRRALLHAIDRQQLVDVLMAGLSQVTHSWIPPNDPRYGEVESLIVKYDYDPRRATQMIEGLGYLRASDGSFHDANGQRLGVEARTISLDVNRKSLLAVADFWQRVGVAADPVVVPTARQSDREYRATFPGFDLLRGAAKIEQMDWLHSDGARLPENDFRGRGGWGRPARRSIVVSADTRRGGVCPMAEPILRFRYHEPDIDTNRPIVEGQVKIEGFELQVLPNEATEYDVWELGSSSMPVSAVGREPDVSIPVWPNRKFRHSYMFINSAAGIEQPGDLEGKRVALASWNNPGGVWAKGALQNYYEVDLTTIDWFIPEADRTPIPGGIRTQRVPLRRDFDRMLVEGELDAVLEPNRLPSIVKGDPRVRRLFPDYKSEEQKYWRETGIFPISHIVTMKREFVDRYPEAPVALLKAYRQARDIAFDRVLGSDPEYLIMTWAAAGIEEQKALMGADYWSYNIVDNRRTLEALTQFVHQQGLTPTQVDYNQCFDAAAASLPGV